MLKFLKLFDETALIHIFLINFVLCSVLYLRVRYCDPKAMKLFHPSLALGQTCGKQVRVIGTTYKSHNYRAPYYYSFSFFIIERKNFTIAILYLLLDRHEVIYLTNFNCVYLLQEHMEPLGLCEGSTTCPAENEVIDLGLPISFK